MATEAPSQGPIKLKELLEVNGIASLGGIDSNSIKINQHSFTFGGPTDSVGPGDLCKVKVLYEGPPKCNCCINWVDHEPENLKEAIEEQTESKKHALLIRMKKNHSEGKPLVLDSIVVQNEYLKELLGRVFRGYSGITTTLKKLVFRQPFQDFFHEWKNFSELCESEKESEKRKLAQLLQSVLSPELEETLSRSDDLAANRVITYDYLWTIFRPGIDVFSSQSGRDCIYQLVSAKYDKLEAIPLSLHTDSVTLKAEAEARGIAARDYQTIAYHYAAYDGTAKDADDEKFNVSGRIIIDAAAYELFNVKKKLTLKPLSSRLSVATIDVSDKSQDHTDQVYSAIHCYRGLPDAPPQEPELIRKDKKKQVTLPSLSDEFLYLCSSEVRGYCLQTKRWATFDVDFVGPVRWNENAFENLVIAQDYKRLILAFVESQVANKDQFDDLIEGKGRGLIMLLEGSPGVGKTLTAEAIADRVKRPLYALSGGELGQDARHLEGRLSMILQVATKWDAVLLLDECDVFLEKRSVNNLLRNSTVAVMLRLLEYHQGILFMTTNRVSTIDPAFESRIHLTIEYPKLEYEARHQIWTHFLRIHCRDSQVLNEEIEELAQIDMNGREIKNLVKTAQLLARHENSVLTAGHVQTVVQVFKQRRRVEDSDESAAANAESGLQGDGYHMMDSEPLKTEEMYYAQRVFLDQIERQSGRYDQKPSDGYDNADSPQIL